jgi:transposase
MAYFAGLDVSVKETSVCIVDDAGKIVREARVASEPEALLQMLTNNRLARVGLEAEPLSQWLIQRSRRSGVAGDLRRDAAHAGRAEGTDQQDRSQ